MEGIFSDGSGTSGALQPTPPRPLARGAGFRRRHEARALMAGDESPARAALPLYDWPELRDATDAFWAALAPRIAAAGLPAPATLDRAAEPDELWNDPELVFAQTCGLPHVAGAARATRLIATPVYEVEGCGAGRYSSAIVTRANDPRDLRDLQGARFAANGPGSLSGWAALAAVFGAEGIGEILWTGAHRTSIIEVANGGAEAAAIDAVVWDMARRFEPAAADLRVVAWSDPAPAPPFVTSALRESGDRARIRAALVDTLVDPATAAIRAELRLSRIVAFADPDYDPARRLAQLARRAERRVAVVPRSETIHSLSDR